MIVAWLMALGVAATPLGSEPLPRRAMLGLPPGPSVDGGVGVQVVLPKTTAARLGIEVGDALLEVNGHPTPDAAALFRALQGSVAGDVISVVFQRKGKRHEKTGVAVARPHEAWTGATVSYGAADVEGGRLRTITVRPEKAIRAPVVFYLQGYTCGSIEWMQSSHPLRQVLQPVVDEGYAIHRVEKLGVGDSRTRAHCSTASWAEEQTAFREAYLDLLERRGIDASRVVLFGHSLGGVVAPLLASKVRTPAGLAVYGTVLRPWHQYLLDVVRVQPTLADGADPVAAARLARDHERELWSYLFEGADPEQLIRASPEAKERWRRGWEYEGGPSLIGRAHAFWRGLAQVELTKAWHSVNSPVLVLHGTSDIEVIDDGGAEHLVRVVNHARSGRAELVRLAGTDHGFRRVGDESQHRERRRAQTVQEAPVNPEVASSLLSWLRRRVP